MRVPLLASAFVVLFAFPDPDFDLPDPPTQILDEEDVQFEFQDQTPKATLFTKQNGMCVDFTLTTFHRNKVLQTGPIPSGFVARPSTLSVCELEQLHRDCTERINKYRSGEIRFSDGSVDSNVRAGLSPLGHRRGSNSCSSGAALGDLITNVAQGGGCSGGHENAFVCTPLGSRSAQNSCCGRGGGSFGNTRSINTYTAVKSELFSCLQQMWDEGIKPGQKGHWETMRNPALTHVSCGFAFTANGRVMMNQDFYARDAPCTPACTACNQRDTCGGRPCVCAGTTGTTDTPITPETADTPVIPNSGSGGGSNGGVIAGAVIAVVATVSIAGFAVWKLRQRSKVADNSRFVRIESRSATKAAQPPLPPKPVGSVAAMKQKFES